MNWKAHKAIERIKQILEDDKNYQTPLLMVGAIWDVCDNTANFRRGESVEGTGFIEVTEKEVNVPGE